MLTTNIIAGRHPYLVVTRSSLSFIYISCHQLYYTVVFFNKKNNNTLFAVKWSVKRRVACEMEKCHYQILKPIGYYPIFTFFNLIFESSTHYICFSLSSSFSFLSQVSDLGTTMADFGTTRVCSSMQVCNGNAKIGLSF